MTPPPGPVRPVPRRRPVAPGGVAPGGVAPGGVAPGGVAPGGAAPGGAAFARIGLALAALCLVSLALLGHGVRVDLGYNDGIFLAVARLALDGHALYREIYDIKPPWLFALYAAGLTLTPLNFLGVRIVLALAYGATALLTGVLARRAGLPVWAAALAAVLSLGLLQIWAFHDSSGLVLPFVLGACLLWLRDPDTQTATRPAGAARALAAGALSGLALGVKHTALFQLAPLLALALWPLPGRARGRLLLWSVGGGVLSLFPLALYLTLHQAWAMAWIANVSQPLAYVSSLGVGPWGVRHFLGSVGALWSALVALLVLASVALALAWIWPRTRVPRPPPGLTVALALAWGGVTAALSLGAQEVNVWAPAVPGLVLSAALLVAWLCRMVAAGWPRRAATAGVLAVAAVLSAMEPALRQMPSALVGGAGALVRDARQPRYSQAALLPHGGARVQYFGKLTPQAFTLADAVPASPFQATLNLHPNRVAADPAAQAMVGRLAAMGLAALRATPADVILEEPDPQGSVFGLTLADLPGWGEVLAGYGRLCPVPGFAWVQVWWHRRHLTWDATDAGCWPHPRARGMAP